jgi:hypothetical protein
MPKTDGEGVKFHPSRVDLAEALHVKCRRMLFRCSVLPSLWKALRLEGILLLSG